MTEQFTLQGVLRRASRAAAVCAAALLLPALLLPTTAQAQTTSSTALSATPNPSTYTQTVTLTATVTGSSPTGNVTFKDGSATLAIATLSSGVASYSTTTFSIATHSLTAVYAGDANNTASTSSAVSQVVSKYASTTALASSVNPSTAGQSTTLTATVTGASPSGVITFKDGATTLATRALSSGAATLAITNLTKANHSLTAVYAGDTYNTASTSTAITQTVTFAATTLTLSAPASASQGQNVTLIAQISNALNPSGLVTFTDSATTLGTASVSAGEATFATSALAVGSHTLNASYAGDANNNAASTASPASLTVSTRSGTTWQYGYDATGRVNTVVDPNGQASYFYYDSLGRAIQSQQPANTGSGTPTVIDLGYDFANNLTSVLDPRALTTTYAVTGLGTTSTQSSPDTATTTFTYDAKGHVLTRTDARGKTTNYSWDALDRLTSMSYPTGTTTTFEYDGGASPTPAAAGELTKITDESGQTTFSYDAMGRMTGKSVAIGTRTFTVSYGWGDSGSALDKLTSITYPSGSRVNYSYDSNGYVSAISVNPVNANGVGYGSAQTLLSTITYNAENRVTGWLWSDGKARTIGYDSVGQVTTYTLGDPIGTSTKAGVIRTLTRDGAGRITGYTHTNSGSAMTALDQGFAYDNLNRLTSQTVNGAGTVYAYDATGNRTSKTISGTIYTNTVASTSNKYTQVQDTSGTATINHDAAGNVVGDGSYTYTYSDRGRMSSVSISAGTVTYAFNGLGQRAKKAGPTAAVVTGAAHFVYDEAGQLLGEYDANGNPVYETIYLNTTPVGAIKQTGTSANSDIAVTLYNAYADQIETTRMITQQDHTIVWRWDTAEAFGGTSPDQDPNSLGTFAFNQRFPGQVFDAETGLFQNWNREYNARLGRYVESDPIGLDAGINTFSYVGGSPLTYVDPEGLFGWADMPTAPQWAENFGAGFGDVVTFGASRLIREHYDFGSVDKCSAAYAGGEFTGIGVSLLMGGRGLANAGFRVEKGAWKQGGEWFAGGEKVRHFHMGTGPGMAMHHLPYQFGNWARNFAGNMSRGKAGGDLGNMAAAAFGFGAAANGAATGAMNECTCKR